MFRRRAALTLRREDGRVVCESVTVADTTLRRLRGLLGRGSLRPDQGMVLRPAWSIHTAFLRFPIDVVFLDGEQVVMRIDDNVRPFSTSSCRGAREIVELAAGECERRGLTQGDRIAWASRNVVNDIAIRESPSLQGEVRATVLVASGDLRFVKLVRFLLEGRGIAVGEQRPESLSGSLEDAGVDAVLIDSGTSLGAGLRTLNNARAQRPELPMIVVGEEIGDRPLEAVRVYDKWQETEVAIDALEKLIFEDSAG